MPPPTMTVPAPLSVALDATPLLGTRTGIGRAVAGVLEALARSAAEERLRVSAYGLTARGWRSMETAVPAGVPVRAWPVPASALLRAWRTSDWPPAELLTGRADVVHGTNFVVPPTRRAGRLVSVHDLTPELFPGLCTPTARRYPSLVRRALSSGAEVHTWSESVAREVVDHLGADPSRVHVVPPGLPPARPVPTARVRPGRPYVLGMGTVEPRKNFPRLVAAFDLLASELDDLDLVIAGPPGWGQEALDRAIAAAGHRHRIHLAGYVDDPAGLMSGAAVFAFPSLYEGFGFPPLEAMAAGVPVVASRAGSLPEVLGDAALFVDPLSVDGTADALRRAVVDSQLRAGLVELGRRRAAEYDWDRTAGGLSAVYRRLGRR